MSEWSARVYSALPRSPSHHLSLSDNIIKAPAPVQHVEPLGLSYAAPPRPSRARPPSQHGGFPKIKALPP